jgi:ubiquinone/menaquinone biosynthesis C-methylase UbiE
MPDSDLHVDYDKIAETYNRRFAADPQNQLARAILTQALARQPGRILEVGCGTGRWLADLHPAGELLYGLDLSIGMLHQARARDQRLHLVQGRAERLPFPASTFNLVYCVNALHHFSQPQDFIREAYRLLGTGGALAIIGMDPNDFANGSTDLQWYVYRYFGGALENDLARFPSRGKIAGWMAAAGFQACETSCVESIRANRAGWSVFDDPFLNKDATSQLTLLTQAAYTEGLNRMKEALIAADQKGETLVFPVDIRLYSTVGRVIGEKKD